MAAPTMRLAGDDSRAIPRKVALTKTLINRTVCPGDQRAVIIYDDAVRGLCIHVTKTSRSFYLYRKANGRPLRFKIGTFPELSVDTARQVAMKHLGQIVQGVDPRDERRAIRASITLQELWERWEQHSKPRHTLKTRRSDKSRFETCFGDWKGRKLTSIREHDVREKHAALAEKRGATTANRAVQLLRRMYNFARITPNPAANKSVSFFRERARDRFLQPEELPRFFAALEQEPNETLRDFFYVSLLTGARRSNVESMRWDEINLQGGTWTIPGTKTKNGDPLAVHLVDEAKKILERRQADAIRRRLDGDTRYGEWVFPSKRVDAKTPHLSEPKGGWVRILKAAKIKDLRVHDLRRTLGSWQAVMGTSLPIIGKSLGHLNQATTAIYARLHLDPVRASVNAAANAMLTAGKIPEEPK